MNYKWNYQPPTQEEREAAKALNQPCPMPLVAGAGDYFRRRSQAFLPPATERTARPFPHERHEQSCGASQ